MFFPVSFSGTFNVSKNLLISLNSTSLFLVSSSFLPNCINSSYSLNLSLLPFLFNAISLSFWMLPPMLNANLLPLSFYLLATYNTPQLIILSTQFSASFTPSPSFLPSVTLLLDSLSDPLYFVLGTCTNLKSNIRIAMIHLFIAALGCKSSLFNIPFMY